ncbi:MAG: hypothetical protein AAF735_00365 [Myxococcota bacterium]
MSRITTVSATGDFVDLAGERCYAIENVDAMQPFLISVVSDQDHWLFASSTGGLTAGRISPETSLFPYITVDKIHDSAPHTAGVTIIRVSRHDAFETWEPFRPDRGGRYALTRNLYKSVLGNMLCFEELNHDLELRFRATWRTSDRYGFVRDCSLATLGASAATATIVDGLQNVLPAGTPLSAQSNSSNLVDAYKLTELDESTGLALFTLYAGITDRAEPRESLRANTAFCLGLEAPVTLLSTAQLDRFRSGEDVSTETHQRGVRGAYLVADTVRASPETPARWRIVADIEQSQSHAVALRSELRSPGSLSESIDRSVARGSDTLARIIASADGFQQTAEEHVSVHHYANVLFNTLRGGVVDDNHRIRAADLIRTVLHFNRPVFESHERFLRDLPERIGFHELLEQVTTRDDPQLERLTQEYLPITFGRRHGDPSRPWNRFAINIKDESGERLLSYEGNWRDIFQNWEALAMSFPGFIENMIAKFVNASTRDGHNPYRITKQGIDWEVEDPEDPWSYIGYWGDHQIIYLLRLLEHSVRFHPGRLRELLRRPIFAYANIPYRIKGFSELVRDPKHTVSYDQELADDIAQRVSRLGADGKLVLDTNGNVFQVTLLEKLLVPLLAKLGNLVVDGGIWMNTQRPEWNDANNALVGHGLSMVTLYSLRRYMSFLTELLAEEAAPVQLSPEVERWMVESARVLGHAKARLNSASLSPSERLDVLRELGEAAERYRAEVYADSRIQERASCSLDPIRHMLDDALVLIDASIETNRRDDALYHAYNVLEMRDDSLLVHDLYPMLEGQVAAIGTGALSPQAVIEVVNALFESPIYRADQDSFMLYPDRDLPGFLQKNRIPDSSIAEIELLRAMLDTGDTRIVARDIEGQHRFHSDFANVGDLNRALDRIDSHREYPGLVEPARGPLRELYETVFEHRKFTGRSGTMFAFEGLGSIYWHMVSKLLLAVQESYFAAEAMGSDDATRGHLAELYYRIRAGLGFNKTPAQYGAFPTDPYSHTPKHKGASQPGMTGQVKEEVLSRFGELGVRVERGAIRFRPSLLRSQELLDSPAEFSYLGIDGEWQSLTVPTAGLGFTWCQVPIVYRLDEVSKGITLWRAGEQREDFSELRLPASISREIFQRTGVVRRLEVRFGRSDLMRAALPERPSVPL